MTHLNYYRKQHKHFGLFRVRERRESVGNSVKVTVVVSLSLHYQQCDSFRKIKQENFKWTGVVILYVAFHCLFAPWGPH